MNKKEKDLAETYADRLVNSIDLLTKALNYHADVIGYKADNANTQDKVTISAEIKEEVLTAKSATTKVPFDVSLKDVKEALNKMAKTEGTTKEDVLALVVEFTGDSYNPADIPEDRYEDILKRTSAHNAK